MIEEPIRFNTDGEKMALPPDLETPDRSDAMIPLFDRGGRRKRPEVMLPHQRLGGFPHLSDLKRIRHVGHTTCKKR
jgi:hypothetical protein